MLFRMVIAALLLSLFSSKAYSQPTKNEVAENIVVSIKPLHSFVAAVSGKIPILLLDGQQSPHGFRLTSQQIRTLYQADILFYIDKDVEFFLQKALRNAPDSLRRASAIEYAPLNLIKTRGRNPYFDGHVWLDPKNAQKITLWVAQELGKILPEQDDFYQKNAIRYNKEIDRWDADLKRQTSVFNHKPFIVFHDAYGYLGRHYGLNIVGTVVVDPEQPLSVQRVIQIKEKIQAIKNGCVFVEPQFSSRIILTLLEGTSAKLGKLDPLGSNIKSGRDHYAQMMQDIVRNLEQCLGT